MFLGGGGEGFELHFDPVSTGHCLHMKTNYADNDKNVLWLPDSSTAGIIYIHADN